MNTVADTAVSWQRSLADLRSGRVAYWVATVTIGWELVFGGVWDLLKTDYVYGIVVEDLGYPEYFLVILGVWKLPGGVVLLAPRLPRLKEWAYAGAFFTYSGAVASHIVMGDSFQVWWGPAGFAVVLMVSWGLRPSSRRNSAEK
jgi:hypothetical protein